MKIIYATIFGSLVATGVFLVLFSPFQEKDASVLQDLSESIESLLPTKTESDLPHGTPTESVSLTLFAQNVPDDVCSIPTVISVLPSTIPSVIEQQSATVPQQSTENAVSYVYFYTGVPVRPVVPTATVVYMGGFTPVVPVPTVQMPVVQPYSIPIFVPQVVPSRVGTPKLVYTNGVVVKPKVYYPRQPVRNSLRGVTP